MFRQLRQLSSFKPFKAPPSSLLQPVPTRPIISLYEYDAARLLKQYGVQVPKGQVALMSREAYLIAKQVQHSSTGYVVKAQVLPFSHLYSKSS